MRAIYVMIIDMGPLILAAVWVLFLTVVSSVRAQPPLRNYSEISSYLERNSKTSLEEFLLLIDPEIRKRFQLVYESRSPNQATLARPRIILTNDDASLILGIPGDHTAKRGNIVEIIEASEITGELKFREISFERASVTMDHTPKLCANCHGNNKSEFRRSAMRPIWDGYPDWPGVFGSSHNDAAFYQTSKYGNGSIPKLEFEETALRELLAKAKSLPRYSALIGIESATTSKLSHVNTMFTEALLRRNLLSMLSKYEEAIYEAYLTSPTGYSRLRNELIEFMDKGIESRKIAEFRKSFEGKMESQHNLEKKKKTARLRKLIDSYGTAEDRALFTSKLGTFTRPQARWDGKLGVALGDIDHIIPLVIAGVDPSTFAITRELMVTGLGSPEVGNIRTVWKNSIRLAIRNPLRPAIGNGACKITISPVDVKSTDEISDNWITWLAGE